MRIKRFIYATALQLVLLALKVIHRLIWASARKRILSRRGRVVDYGPFKHQDNLLQNIDLLVAWHSAGTVYQPLLAIGRETIYDLQFKLKKLDKLIETRP